MSDSPKEFEQSFFHGTRADFKVGEMIKPNFESNYVADMKSKYVYFTSNLAVAAWGGELASGNGKARIYVVKAVGSFEDDPNVTNKRFPGNPTNSFRSTDMLEVIGEVMGWSGHSPEEIKKRKESIDELFKSGAGIIE